MRNTKSSHWRRWLDVPSRCVVPSTSFSEPEVLEDRSRPPVWFAKGDRELCYFAGIWVPDWTSRYKLSDELALQRPLPEGVLRIVALGRVVGIRQRPQRHSCRSSIQKAPAWGKRGPAGK